MPRAKKLHICAIGAHIGDVEFTCGAALCKYTAAGHRATIIHMTAGEKGNPAEEPEAYRAARIREAEAAANLMGADVIVLPYRDTELPNNDEAKFAVCDLLRELKPDILLTHWKGSFHKDHANLPFRRGGGGVLRRRAGSAAQAPAHSIRLLYFAEKLEDPYDYHPDLWLDVSPVYDQWLEAARQLALFRGEVSSFDYQRYYTGLAQTRGAEVGVRHAVTVMMPGISRKPCREFFPIEDKVLIF
jgi:LmbE family N-acetylglucosaminyl deacetylase